MSSHRSTTVHIRAVVVRTRSSKCRVCDSLGVESESNFVRIVLGYRKCSRNELRLMPISPSMLVFIRIICAGRLQTLEISIMKHLFRVSDKLSFLEFCHGVETECDRLITDIAMSAYQILCTRDEASQVSSLANNKLP